MKKKQLIKDLTFVTLGIGALTLMSVSPVLAHAAETPVAMTETTKMTTKAHALSTGHFEGRSKHITSGQVKILKTSNGYELHLGDDFSLDGAPSPVLGFGNDGNYDMASTFAALEKKNGRQTYKLPAGFTPENYTEIYVWCEDFSVPLGVAALS